MNNLAKLLIILAIIAVVIIILKPKHSNEGFGGGHGGGGFHGGGGRGWGGRGRWGGGRGWGGGWRGGYWPYDTYPVYYEVSDDWQLIGTVSKRNKVLNLYQNGSSTKYKVVGNGQDVSFNFGGYIQDNQTVNIPGLDNSFIVHLN